MSAWYPLTASSDLRPASTHCCLVRRVPSRVFTAQQAAAALAALLPMPLPNGRPCSQKEPVGEGCLQYGAYKLLVPLAGKLLQRWWCCCPCRLPSGGPAVISAFWGVMPYICCPQPDVPNCTVSTLTGRAIWAAAQGHMDLLSCRQQLTPHCWSHWGCLLAPLRQQVEQLAAEANHWRHCCPCHCPVGTL